MLVRSRGHWSAAARVHLLSIRNVLSYEKFQGVTGPVSSVKVIYLFMVNHENKIQGISFYDLIVYICVGNF